MQFPHYNLYIYGEGEKADKYYKGLFTGIPVLFIPGNVGSHKQGENYILFLLVDVSHIFEYSSFLLLLNSFPLFTVRSLASVAYRKTLESRKHFHFDFFTIEFNEELSAFHGALLDQQVSFVRQCIQKIFQLYLTKHQARKSLILIGHSMARN